MENENFQILSNSEINEINIITDYIKKKDKQKESACNTSNKDSDSSKIETSYVFIPNSFVEEKKNVEDINQPETVSRAFNLLDDITKREKILLSIPFKKDKQFKKLSFKEILLNVKKLNNETRKRFKLKWLKRKSRKDDK